MLCYVGLCGMLWYVVVCCGMLWFVVCGMICKFVRLLVQIQQYTVQMYQDRAIAVQATVDDKIDEGKLLPNTEVIVLVSSSCCVVVVCV